MHINSFTIGLSTICFTLSCLAMPLHKKDIAKHLQMTTSFDFESHHLIKRQNDSDDSDDSDDSTTTNGTAITLPLYNDQTLQAYAVKISVGTPLVDFFLLFDTGSADTWVPSIKCQKENGCLSDRRINPNASSTYVPTNIPYNFTYGSGEVQGNYFNDTIQLKNTLLPRQFLASVDHLSGALAQQTGINLDGIFGASFSTDSSLSQFQNKTYSTIPMALYENKIIPKPLFSVYMGQTNRSEWSGQVTIGGVDQDNAASTIKYIDVAQLQDQGGHAQYVSWITLASSIQVSTAGGASFSTIESNNTGDMPFLFDTGTNSVYLPTKMADQVVKDIAPDANKVNSTYFVNCSYLEDTRAFRINFNGSTFVPEQPEKSVVTLEVPIGKLVQPSGSMCELIIRANDSTYPTLGNLILRHFVTVFDFGAYVIGFAPIKQ
ncbi:aspartic peptidase domain-containing protein [Spinellus fusiger]|nr:aspartic peptidase domain-containing protein [Spinellus fusiger]